MKKFDGEITGSTGRTKRNLWKDDGERERDDDDDDDELDLNDRQQQQGEVSQKEEENREKEREREDVSWRSWNAADWSKSEVGKKAEKKEGHDQVKTSS